MAVVEISDFPPVLTLDVYQASDERPGKIIVHTPVTHPTLSLEELPFWSNLTVQLDNFTGLWQDIRMIKAPRVRHGHMRTVFEDNRWKLRETRLSESFNLRTCEGTVITDTEKTITELVEHIEEKVGIGLTVGALPDFNPTARWAGRTAEEAMRDLLAETGCRLVYNPEFQEYVFTKAGEGFLPDLSSRVFRPNFAPRIKTLYVQSDPIMYEDRISVKAVEMDDTNHINDLDPVLVPTDPDHADKQSALRHWAVDGDISHPEVVAPEDVVLLPYRAKSHVYDSRYLARESGRIIRDSFERFPFHKPYILSPEDEKLEQVIALTSGGKVFVTDHPIMMTDNTGNLLDTATLLTAYHIRKVDPDNPDNTYKDLERSVKEIEVNPQGTGSKRVTVRWIKPVDSTESDIGTDAWDALLDDVAEAIARFYNSDTGVIKFPYLQNLQGSGHIGSVHYHLSDQHERADIQMNVAINFIPGNFGAIT